MAPSYERYTICERPEYQQQLAALAEIEGLELSDFSKALSVVYYLVSRNPQAYPEIVMSAISIRVAKTELYLDGSSVVPPLRLYYMIKEEEMIVDFIKIERRPGFGLL